MPKCQYQWAGRRPPAIQTKLPSPPLRKKALLIGIRTVRVDDKEEDRKQHEANAAPKSKKKQKEIHNERALKGPHSDVLDMKQLLIDVYEYDPNDITVLIDDDEPDHIQPTRQNMIQKMVELVDGARPGDRFFFHFSGHAMQQDTKNPKEEDGKDGFIISSDGKTIQDDDLKKLLVNSLPIGSSLVAIFDACHSASLLDLEHCRCNRVYVPWRNKGRRKTDFHRNVTRRRNAQIDVGLSLRLVQVSQVTRLSRDAISWRRTSIDQVLASPLTPSSGAFDFASSITTRSKTSLSISTNIEKESWLGDTGSPISRCRSPESLFCTGICRENPSLIEDPTPVADVISLSSSKDGQRTWENPEGSSMTQALIKVLRNDPHPTLRYLLTLISHDIHLFYVYLHQLGREYKEKFKVMNNNKMLKGKEPKKPKSVEIDNFQDPQLSSTKPLDMDRRWHI